LTTKSKDVLQQSLYSQKLQENLIVDLLDLAKLENSSFNISKSYFNLGKLVVQTFQMISYTATAKGIELHADIDSISDLYMIS